MRNADAAYDPPRRIPGVDPVELRDRLLVDAVAILAQRSDVRVVPLSASTPEMRHRLRGALAGTLGLPADELLDLWHLPEKLAQVIYREASTKAPLTQWRWNLRPLRKAVPLAA